MKLKHLMVLAGIVLLAAGCSRKCPPCPTCSAPASYGTGYESAAPATTGASSYSTSPSNSSSYGSAPAYNYAKK